MSRTGYVLPGGENEWFSEYISTTNNGDYNNPQPGIVKFDDGTIWWVDSESGNALHDRGGEGGIYIFEYVPGGKAWELLMGDWSDTAYGVGGGTATSGDMNNFYGGRGARYWMPFYSGVGDKMYAWDYADDDQYVLLEFDKSDRTWKTYRAEVLASGDGTLGAYRAPTSDDTYFYHMAYTTGLPGGGNRLIRARHDAPGDLEVLYDLRSSDTSAFLGTINTSTGLEHVFDDDISTGSLSTMAYHDGYLYTTETGGLTAMWYSMVRRLDLSTGLFELLYYLRAYVGGIPSVPLAFRTDGTGYTGGGELPIGSGLYPYHNSTSRVRNDWLYWLDQHASHSSQNQTFTRIYLPDLIRDGPIEHDPYNPTYEILNNASTPAEGDAKWYNVSEWGILYREGNSPIHNTITSAWFFDDDGSIVFCHEEFLPWMGYSTPSFGLTSWVVSRLVPPGAGNISARTQLNLVFEGQALKGYSRVRELHGSFAPDELIMG